MLQPMNRRVLVLFGEDLPAVALAQLDASGSSAAWLIDVDAGRIIAANGNGAALLGLNGVRVVADADLSPPLLDASMPALVRLRALAASSDQDTSTEALVFWTRNGALRLPCRIHLSRARLPRSGARTVAAIIVQDPSHDLHDASDAANSSFAGNDAAKLKEIARRIHEGQAARGLTEERAGPRTPSAAALSDGGASPSDREFSPTLRARLAHELKTPLSAIAAAAEIMKEQRFGPLGSARYLGYASDIFGSAQHMIGVIERMLAEGTDHDPLSLVAALEFAEIDAGAVLAASVSQVAPLAERAGIALAFELAPRLPHIVADATSLRQIVFNLLTNAIKFTESGGSVRAVAHYEVDGPFTIAISDTGSGMTPRELSNVSDAMKASRTKRKGKGAGLGLGLPMVQMLAEANGASLIIESVPGQGTSASVVFRKERVVPV
ncbi:HAMP domain-containing sensor histidine kinase [Hyphomicrobium sp. LHD-15]|uniref:sensor histidine kinase n=1 Tax=Hyphomicrobium sp. LHD-15 TaxID=3072142 RepID=UPI00280DF77B|nr:HAMP domain-containing sensor histidine kinase [Hyphomicrobium sp. LHD-15]MDQ8698425.1 HAMP domain-containing sensor histidine kinase [Hyphomicrobium sp. LHD-15]